MALLKSQLQLPDEWYLVKVINFRGETLVNLREWLSENIHSPYKEVGWRHGCGSKVGVAFSNAMDAVMFRLRWS